jgi:hypothetical protein
MRSKVIRLVVADGTEGKRCLINPFLLGAFAKSRKATISFVMSVCLSVCPHGTTPLPLDGFSWNFIFEDFSKFSRGNSSLMKVWQNDRYFTWRPMYITYVLYMKTYVHLWHLAQFFLKWEMFQTKSVEKVKRHIFCSITFFFQKSCCLWHNVKQYGTDRQVTDGSIMRRTRFACWITKATDIHSEFVIHIAFLQQQWLRERGPVLRYT